MSPTSIYYEENELLFSMSEEDIYSGISSEKENVIPYKEQNIFDKTIDNEPVEYNKKPFKKVACELKGGTWDTEKSSNNRPIQSISPEEWVDEVLLRPQNEHILFLMICCAQNNQSDVNHLITEMSPEEICESISYIRKEKMKMSGTDLEIHLDLVFNALQSSSEDKKKSILEFLNIKINYYTYLQDWIYIELKKLDKFTSRLSYLFEETIKTWNKNLVTQGYYRPMLSSKHMKKAPTVNYTPTLSNPHYSTRKNLMKKESL